MLDLIYICVFFSCILLIIISIQFFISIILVYKHKITFYKKIVFVSLIISYFVLSEYIKYSSIISKCSESILKEIELFYFFLNRDLNRISNLITFNLLFIILVFSITTFYVLKCFKTSDYKRILVYDTFFILFIFFMPIFPITYEPPIIKTSSIKANMHTFQTRLEIYAIDWNGYYPKNIKELKEEATKKEYWKEVKNPFQGSNKTFLDLPYFNKKIDCLYSLKEEEVSFEAGVVIYNPIIDKEYKITKYYLYGTYLLNNKSKLIEDKGQIFYLTNQ